MYLKELCAKEKQETDEGLGFDTVDMPAIFEDGLCCRCGDVGGFAYNGYGDVQIEVCKDCALQLARYIMEDICAAITTGGRHG